jgi:flagellar hook-length control protein FliK
MPAEASDAPRIVPVGGDARALAETAQPIVLGAVNPAAPEANQATASQPVRMGAVQAEAVETVIGAPETREQPRSRRSEPAASAALAAGAAPTVREAASAAPVENAAEVSPRRIIEQVVRAVRVEVRDGHSEMTLRLDPAGLGHMQVRLTTDEQGVTASFHAGSEAVRSALEANMPALRSALAEAGVQVQQFHLSSGSDFSQFNQFNHQPGQQQAPARQPVASSSAAPTAELADAAPSAPWRSATEVDYFA